MKNTAAILVGLFFGLVAGQAQASNQLYLTSDYFSADSANIASVTLGGDHNGLSLAQTFDSKGGPNRLNVDITGDLNGGPLDTSFGPLVASAGLAPGQLIQTGHDNAMSITVTGGQNLFAVSQVGAYNMLIAMVVGNNNQAAVAQIGLGNSLSFTQNGSGTIAQYGLGNTANLSISTSDTQIGTTDASITQIGLNNDAKLDVSLSSSPSNASLTQIGSNNVLDATFTAMAGATISYTQVGSGIHTDVPADVTSTRSVNVVQTQWATVH